MKNIKKKILLAYSGGLDTSVILKWLIQKNYEVYCYVADVGQEEDFKAVKDKALKLGAKQVFIDDLKSLFVEEFIVPFLKTGATYEGRYLLGTALARPLIAKGMVAIALKLGLTEFSHGATGKGNDQVRFELGIYQLMPEATVIAPWRVEEFLSKFQGRPDLLSYAKEEAIPVEASTKKPYSIDANLMHVSYEGGMLEDPMTEPLSSMFQLTKSPEMAPEQPTEIEIAFESGVPVKLILSDKKVILGSMDILMKLNKIAGENAIGRIDIIENRAVGIKSRGVYETPGCTVLAEAHHDLELLTLDREVYRIKEMLAPKIAEVIYNGLWYSPEMKFLMAAVNESQKFVTGSVKLKLYKGSVTVVGRSSSCGLYSAKISSMDVHGGYNAADADGFIKIQSLRLQAASKQVAN